MKRRPLMRPTKRKQLEASGWRVGSVQDFLGLEDRQVALIDMRLALAAALRERRLRSGLSQVALARMLDTSQSRVAKMEASEPGVTFDALILALLALGATARDIGKILGTPAA